MAAESSYQKAAMSLSENLSMKMKNLEMTDSKPNWVDTPPELLNLISERLEIIEWFAFRGVCRVWREASSSSPASPSSITMLWSIIFKTNSPDCILLKPDSDIKYRARLPELGNSTCIASRSGWILAHYNPTHQFFFFHAFNGSRINLPRLPWKRNSGMIGAFSAPPTDKNCVVCIGSNNLITFEMEIHVLRHGESQWQLCKPIYYDPWLARDVNLLIDMIYRDGYVFVVDIYHHITGFSVQDGILSVYQWPVPLESAGGHRVPFKMGDGVFSVNKLKKLLGLTDAPVSVLACGTVVDEERLIGKRVWEEGDASLERKEQIQVVLVEPRVCEVTQKLT